MKPLQLARNYMHIVFISGKFDELATILAEDLEFRGPLFQYNRAGDYIHAMKTDPPAGFKYQLIKSYENDSSVCLVYEFSKPGISTTMVQIFGIEDDKIKSIQLVFDTRAFETPD